MKCLTRQLANMTKELASSKTKHIKASTQRSATKRQTESAWRSLPEQSTLTQTGLQLSWSATFGDVTSHHTVTGTMSSSVATVSSPPFAAVQRRPWRWGGGATLCKVASVRLTRAAGLDDWIFRFRTLRALHRRVWGLTGTMVVTELQGRGTEAVRANRASTPSRAAGHQAEAWSLIPMH